MKCIGLIHGAGEGCDYSIGCNQVFKVFELPVDDEYESDQVKDAIEEWVLETWDCYGGDECIDQIEVYAVDEKFGMPLAFDQRSVDLLRLGDEALAEELREENDSLKLRAERSEAETKRMADLMRQSFRDAGFDIADDEPITPLAVSNMMTAMEMRAKRKAVE